MEKNIVFEITREEGGGYSAAASGDSFLIATQGDTLDELLLNIEDATTLHLEDVKGVNKVSLPNILLSFPAHA